MTDPVRPTSQKAPSPEPAARSSTGEGAETALAAMIRKRKMGENHVDDVHGEAAATPTPQS